MVNNIPQCYSLNKKYRNYFVLTETNKRALLNLSIQKEHLRVNINSCYGKHAFFYLPIKSNLNVSFEFYVIMLIAYFRLFTQTVNNNEAMPFVAMAVDNSLQFELSIRVEVGVCCVGSFDIHNMWQHLQPHAVKRNRLIPVDLTLWLPCNSHVLACCHLTTIAFNLEFIYYWIL